MHAQPNTPTERRVPLLIVVGIVAVLAVTVAVLLTGRGGAGTAAAGESETPAAAPSRETTATLDPKLVAQLDDALDESFEASGLPGVIVGLWVPGQGEWVAARGTAELETDDPMTTDSQQKIGSITKTITTTVALQVIGEGEYDLTLDDTIDRWYPDFPEASRITVRMLMNMSSGIGESGIAQVRADLRRPARRRRPRGHHRDRRRRLRAPDSRPAKASRTPTRTRSCSGASSSR